MHKKIIVTFLVATAILSISITQYAIAQQGVIPDNSLLCPEGHDCHCIPSTGVYVDTTSGYRINNGCMDGTGVYNSQVNGGQ